MVGDATCSEDAGASEGAGVNAVYRAFLSISLLCTCGDTCVNCVAAK